MTLGITLIAVAGVLLGVAIISYLHKNMQLVGIVLFIAVWFALYGAAVIDERNATDCPPDSEMHDLGFEGGDS